MTEAKKSIPGIRKIQQLSFVVLDTEATGFDPKKDELLSCGIIGIEEGKIKI
ncbi:MAG TPA: DNA polymerase III subunit epsilon, partial [Algoriphagus sp.]|nr:DNA polymerase III subunit epsilon [Algoriphagus sp.]